MIAPNPAFSASPDWHQKAARPSPTYPRNFVPNDLDLGEWDAQKPLWDDLVSRELPNASALEKWIADWNELSDAVGEESGRRYIDMTCATQDKAIEAAEFT